MSLSVECTDRLSGEGLPAVMTAVGAALEAMEHVPAGPWLAAAIDDIDPQELSEWDLPAYLRACSQVQAWAAARLSDGVAELAGRPGGFGADKEVALALREPVGAAQRRIHHAKRLRRLLPTTRRLFRSGQLGAKHVEALVEGTGAVGDPRLIAAVEDHVLTSPGALAKTARELSRATRRTLTRLDPDGAQDRAWAAREKADVTLLPGEDSMATVIVDAPVEQAIPVKAAADAYAATCKAAGDPRRIGVLRSEGLARICTDYLAGASPSAAAAPRSGGRPIEVGIVIDLPTALGRRDLPGEVPGLGVVPREVIAEMIATELPGCGCSSSMRRADDSSTAPSTATGRPPNRSRMCEANTSSVSAPEVRCWPAAPTPTTRSRIRSDPPGSATSCPPTGLGTTATPSDNCPSPSMTVVPSRGQACSAKHARSPRTTTGSNRHRPKLIRERQGLGCALVTRRYDSSLRQERAALTRERIIDAGAALVHELSSWDWRELKVSAVAERAGVHERTVYRHFPTEQVLRAAVLERLQQEAGLRPEDVTIDNIEDQVARLFAYLASFSSSSERTTDAALAAVDERRKAALLDVVTAQTPRWSQRDQQAAAAVIDVLWGVPSYRRLVDGWHLDDQEATRAVTWLLRLVLADIRSGRGPTSSEG